MDVKTAIRQGDAAALHLLLSQDASRADELIRWGDNDRILTHPLHFVSDMLFQNTLKRKAALPLIDARSFKLARISIFKKKPNAIRRLSALRASSQRT
jgi:hypothetical protein